MISKTISITIPEQLETKLQKEANRQGISRSRFICNILLERQEDLQKATNDCPNQSHGTWCTHFDIGCAVPQSEAETCAGYPSNKE